MSPTALLCPHLSPRHELCFLQRTVVRNLGLSIVWDFLLLEDVQKEMIPSAGIASPVGWGPGEAAGVWEACNCPLGICFACRLKRREEGTHKSRRERLDKFRPQTVSHTHTHTHKHTRETPRKTNSPREGHTNADSQRCETDTQTPSDRPRLAGPRREAETDAGAPTCWGKGGSCRGDVTSPIRALPGRGPCPARESVQWPTVSVSSLVS